MPNDNRVSARLTTEQRAAFRDGINAATEAIAGFALNLTEQERQRLASIGQNRAGLLDVGPQEMIAHPELVPTFIKPDEVLKDVELIRELTALQSATAQLREKIDDILKSASADAFSAFSAIYASVKEARRHNVPGADSVYARLAPFFATRGKKGKSKPIQGA